MKMEELKMFSSDYEILYFLMKTKREFDKIESLSYSEDSRKVLNSIKMFLNNTTFEVVSRL